MDREQATLQAKAEQIYKKSMRQAATASVGPLTPCCLGGDPLSEYGHQIDKDKHYKVIIQLDDKDVVQVYTGMQLGWFLRVLSGLEMQDRGNKRIKRVGYRGLTITPVTCWKT